MDNKIDKQKETIESPHFYSTNFHQVALRSIQPIQSIFPSPSSLFYSKDDRKLSQQRISFASLSHFKPKFDPKSIRGVTSKGNRLKKNFNHKQIDAKMTKSPAYLYQEKADKVNDNQIEAIRKQHKNHLKIKQSLIADQSEDGLNSRDLRYESQQISPYAKYSTNSFPRKSPVSKAKTLVSNNDFLIDIYRPSKKSINQQLQQLQGRISQLTIKNVLQVMTIFSIKQQKCQKKTQGRHKYMKKKENSSTISPQKRQIRISLKTKQNLNIQEPDFTLDKIYCKKIYSFMTFILKLHFSNNMPISKISLSDRYNNEKVKVFVGGGNNKYLIIALLKRRFWFEVVHKITADTKFVWTQNTIKDVHALQKAHKLCKTIEKKVKSDVSLPQNDDDIELPSLNPEVIQLNNQCKLKQKSTSILHEAGRTSEGRIMIKIGKQTQELKKQNAKLFLNPQKSVRIQLQLRKFKIYPKNKNQTISIDQISTITNHVPNNSFIGSKKALFYTMEHYYRNIKKIDPFTIIPKTYHFKNADDPAFSNFLQVEKQSNQKKIWIVKPGQCTNRGTGITLMRACDISRRLLKKQLHPNGQLKTTIVQSYITDPLLYHNRKFDIRHYMLITIINGNLKAYWYDQGYLRTSSEYFTLDNLQNIYIHLTNDAIQKTSEKYGKYEQGNKVSYTQFQRYLDSSFPKRQINFREEILAKMKDIAADVVKANYLNLDRERRVNNFQIFGLDFMIDSKFRPWLIEINANPCLEISCPLLSRIIPTMVEHSLRIGLDPLILPPSHYPPKSRYYLSDNFIQKLKYQIIFDELQQSTSELGMELDYDFDFDEPEDQYDNEGAEIDLGKIID